jgi:hypothetical protein
MTEPRLCRDCRWAINTATGLSRSSSYLYDWKCDHPCSLLPPGPPNLVTGEPEKPYRLRCHEARMWQKGLFDTGIGHCGPEGRFWEPKDGELGFGPPDSPTR